MIRAVRVTALSALVALVTSCAGLTAGFSGTPADVASVIPSMTTVRSLLGDANWWAGPPSFGVLPLDADLVPATVKYRVSEMFLHLGTSESLLVRYTIYSASSAATTTMTDYQSGFGTPAPGPKVGDQVLYYGLAGSGATPLATRTFVRIGQVIAEIVWTRKDSLPSVTQLSKVADAFTSGLKNAGKHHVTAHPVDANLLPPPGLDLTPLGSEQLPIEAFAVMILEGIPDTFIALLHQGGVNNFGYADYALNNDVHMEVQVALLTFPTVSAASDWATTFSPGTPDANGIANAYTPTAGSPAAGQYHYVFSQGVYGAELICEPTVYGEAASRECEDPMARTAIAWKLGLEGVR